MMQLKYNLIYVFRKLQISNILISNEVKLRLKPRTVLSASEVRTLEEDRTYLSRVVCTSDGMLPSKRTFN